MIHRIISIGQGKLVFSNGFANKRPFTSSLLDAFFYLLKNGGLFYQHPLISSYKVVTEVYGTRYLLCALLHVLREVQVLSLLECN
jgi:hypothetical protein